MKKIAAFILVMILSCTLISCDIFNNSEETSNKYSLGGITISLPSSIEVEKESENSIAFKNGLEWMYFESTVNDKYKYDQAYESMMSQELFTNVNKCEIGNLPGISLFSNDHPMFILFDLDKSFAYSFYFSEYKAVDEITYMNIMNSVCEKAEESGANE